MIETLNRLNHYLVTYRGTQFNCTGYRGNRDTFTLLGVEFIDDISIKAQDITIERDEEQTINVSVLDDGETS